jgi:hypothetical protein
MAITTTLVSTAKLGFLSGAFLSSDVYKIALIKAGATGTYDQAFAGNYLPGLVEEVTTAGGYTQLGQTLTAIAYSNAANTASVDWADVTWSASTISAIGAIIYKSSSLVYNPAIAFYDFGGTITSTGGAFAIAIPSAGTGVIRIS